MRYQVEIIYRIKPFFQYRKLESITPMVIEAYRASIMKKLSMKSVNMSVSVLFGIFKKGEEWGLIEKNPVRLKKLKIAEQKCAWWENKEHVLAFLEASKLSHYHLAFRLALECGLRLGEIVGLSKKDVSLDRCQLHIHRQWIDKEQAYGPTKGRKERIVSFDSESGLKELLREAILKSPHPEAIIVTPKGTRASNRKLATHHLNKVIKAAGVPKDQVSRPSAHFCFLVHD